MYKHFSGVFRTEILKSEQECVCPSHSVGMRTRGTRGRKQGHEWACKTLPLACAAAGGGMQASTDASTLDTSSASPKLFFQHAMCVCRVKWGPTRMKMCGGPCTGLCVSAHICPALTSPPQCTQQPLDTGSARRCPSQMILGMISSRSAPHKRVSQRQQPLSWAEQVEIKQPGFTALHANRMIQL